MTLPKARCPYGHATHKAHKGQHLQRYVAVGAGVESMCVVCRKWRRYQRGVACKGAGRRATHKAHTGQHLQRFVVICDGPVVSPVGNIIINSVQHL